MRKRKIMQFMWLPLAFMIGGCGGQVRVQPTATRTPERVQGGPSTLWTPVADSPAAGTCGESQGEIVTMTIRPDIPDPRCLIVQSDQRLRVVNGRQETLAVSLGRLSASIEPGGEHTFEVPIGELLLPGVHVIGVSPCCGGEIWLSR